MPMTPKEMQRVLLRHGFIHVKSNNGSHQKFYSPATNKTVILPIHVKELKND